MPTLQETLPVLSTIAHSRKISTFAHAARQVLEIDGLDHCSTVLDIIETLVLPEVAKLGKVKENETMRLIVLLVVQVLCLETKEGKATRSVHLFTRWVLNPSPWRSALEDALSHLVRYILGSSSLSDILLGRE